MAKLLMISTNIMDDPYPVFPLGAHLVANAVKKAGHSVQMLDIMVDGLETLKKEIAGYHPDYIAFSMRNVDNVNYLDPQSFVQYYKTLINSIKELTSCPVILGGTAYTIFPEQFLEFLGADYGITGPGEISLPRLLTQLEKNIKPVNRVIKGEIDSTNNNSYFLEREGRLTDYYLKEGGMLNLYTKRGCPHQCMYCSYPSLEGSRYWYREPSHIVDEIEYLMKNHSADFIFFTDSVFNDAAHKYLLIMEEMARRNITIPWTCYMRPMQFQQDEVDLLKRTGLHSVEWGTDCSSNVTLAGMGKNFQWDTVREANNLFARNGIPGSHFIIFGGPGETEITARDGIKNLQGLDSCVVFGGIGVRVFPNTGICSLAQKSGLIQSEKELFEREVYYHSPNIDVDWLHQFLLESFKESRHWIYPWTGQSDRNRFMHNSGMRGPLWDLLLKRKPK